MNETKIIGAFFKPRQKAIAKYATESEAIQNKVLCRLVEKAKGTEWGLKHDYRTIKNYQDFQQRVPVQTYEEIKEYVDRMRHGHCCKSDFRAFSIDKYGDPVGYLPYIFHNFFHTFQTCMGRIESHDIHSIVIQRPDEIDITVIV